MGLWQWCSELQWACGSGVVSYCGSCTGVTSYSRPVTGVTVGLWQWCSELQWPVVVELRPVARVQWACGSGVTSYSGPVAVGLRVIVGL